MASWIIFTLGLVVGAIGAALILAFMMGARDD